MPTSIPFFSFFYCFAHGLHGYPRLVLLRSQVIVEEGEFVGRVGQGQFIVGQPFAFL